jgi:hypothetical protein
MNGRDSGRVLVYENDPTVGAHMIAFFAIGTLVFSMFLAWYTFSTMTWGGQAAPLSQRVGFSLVIAAMGVGFFAWAALHNRKVTQRMFYREADDMLEIEHPVLFGRSTRDVPMSALENANFHAGDPEGEVRVHSPWVRIGVHGRRSFFINLPGQVYRYDVFARVLQNAGLDFQEVFIKQAWVEQHG